MESHSLIYVDFKLHYKSKTLFQNFVQISSESENVCKFVHKFIAELKHQIIEWKQLYKTTVKTGKRIIEN